MRAITGLVMLVGGVVAAAAVAAMARPAVAPDHLVVQLLDTFDRARKQPSAELFTLRALAPEAPTVRAVQTPLDSRLTFVATVPRHARLRLSYALSACDAPGNPGWISVGVSDGHVYRELFSTTDVAAASPSQRTPLSLALDEYADLTVAVIFNTRAGRSGNAPGRRLVWADPAIVIK